jgi:hypothetical protein
VAREKVTGKERKSQEEELRNLCSSDNNIRTITSRMMRRAKFKACVEAMINATYFRWKYPKNTLNIMRTWEDNIKIDFNK